MSNRRGLCCSVNQCMFSDVAAALETLPVEGMRGGGRCAFQGAATTQVVQVLHFCIGTAGTGLDFQFCSADLYVYSSADSHDFKILKLSEKVYI